MLMATTACDSPDSWESGKIKKSCGQQDFALN